MSLDKEKITNWLLKRYEEDYFRFDDISLGLDVTHFEQNDNQLSVTYEFWYDGHKDKIPENFLFDFDTEDQYGVNFPSKMQLVKIKGIYTWPSKEECELLNDNLSDEIEDVDEMVTYKWGDPEIDQFIEIYLNNDKESLRDMLINYYHAENGMPDFIPKKLKPYFEKLILSPKI